MIYVLITEFALLLCTEFELCVSLNKVIYLPKKLQIKKL